MRLAFILGSERAMQGVRGDVITSVLWNNPSGYPLDHEGAGGEARRPSEGPAAAARREMSGSGEERTSSGARSEGE